MMPISREAYSVSFLFLVAAFLLMRGAFLLFLPEPVVTERELLTGVFVKEGFGALPASFLKELTVGDRGMILLTVPFFLGLGPNLLALKLAPLCLSFVTFLLGFFFLKNFVSARAALLASGLALFAPVLYVREASFLNGAQAISLALVVLIFYAFYSYLFTQERKRSLIGFGLASGLGFGLEPSIFPVTAACLLTWFVMLRKAIHVGHVALCCFSIVLGLLPWIFLQSPDTALLDFSSRFSSFHLIGDIFPKDLGHIKLILYGCISLGVLLVALFRGGYQWSKESWKVSSPQGIATLKAAPIFLSFLFCLAQNPAGMASSFALCGLLFFFVMGLVIPPKAWGVFALGLLMGLGGHAQYKSILPMKAKALNQAKGYSFYDFGEQLGDRTFRFPEDFQEFKKIASRIRDSQAQRSFYEGYTDAVIQKPYQERKLFQNAMLVPKEHRAYFWKSLGRSLGSNYDPASLARIPREEQAHFKAGLALSS